MLAYANVHRYSNALALRGWTSDGLFDVCAIVLLGSLLFDVLTGVCSQSSV